jgi:2-keto-4-pentenoate hydratase/2-oxohepta-3-ene-1,7-dioic acid hydratase in catechol pathway
MTDSERTLWLGRVRVRAGELVEERAVRVWTDGRAPAADDRVEEIPDPFELARRHRGGGGAHVASLAREVETVRGGISSRVAEVELAPGVRPSKILCIGRNYREHAAEMGNEVPTEPLLFYKPSSALVAPGEAIELPAGFERIDMESELVAVIGRYGRRLDPATAADHVAAYTLGNDVSCRDLQRTDKQWTRAKGFDTFAPLGAWLRVVRPGERVPGEARIQGRLDGDLRQDAPLSAMVFDVGALLAYITEHITVEPGDVVFTGTPQGVSPLRPGQEIEVRLEGWTLGRLSNPVVGREGRPPPPQ